MLSRKNLRKFPEFLTEKNSRDFIGFSHGVCLAAKGHADAFLVLGNPILNAHRKQIVQLAVRHRLPATYARPESGGLMYYGTTYSDLYWRAANYVDKILKGAKPADFPVQQASKFEFVINLKAANRSA